jgi:hypothetical protein
VSEQANQDAVTQPLSQVVPSLRALALEHFGNRRFVWLMIAEGALGTALAFDQVERMRTSREHRTGWKVLSAGDDPENEQVLFAGWVRDHRPLEGSSQVQSSGGEKT